MSHRDGPRPGTPPLAYGMRAGIIAACLISSHLALAQTKPPPENGGTMPPVSIVAEEVDGRLQCSPAELRLPAESNVEFDIVNKTKEQVSLTAPEIFKNKNVLHHDGDLVHVASNDGYLVKQNGKGVLRVRTLPEGQYPYACTAVSDQSEPFRGKLTLVRTTP